MSWRLATRGPFHLEATARVLQRRPGNPVDHFEDGRYRRAFATADGLVLIELENRGSIDEPDVRLFSRTGSPTKATRAKLEETLRKMFGLGLDPAPLQRLAEAEPRLRPTAQALKGMRPPRFAGLFEAFANVVPFQQVSLDAGAAIVGRLVRRFSESVEFAAQRYFAAPQARAIAEARLEAIREVGLSWRKAETLRYLARVVVSGELSEDELAAMTTPAAFALLTELPGIGPWSAGLVLLRGLGRLDVFPQADVGVARGLTALVQLRPPAIDRMVRRFGAQRGYLYFYAIGGALLAKGLIHEAPGSPPSNRASAEEDPRSPAGPV